MISFRRFGLAHVRHYSSKSVELAFDKYGQASHLKPIVVCHGLFGSKQNWKSLAKALSQRTSREIYTVDLRNHGDSPHHHTHNFDSMSQDLIEFIRRQDLNEPVLMGHSMGGKAVMATALRAPSLVSKLIVVDMPPVPLKLGRSFRNYIKAMHEIEQAQVKKQSEADAILAKVEKDVSIRMFLLTNLKRDDQGILRFRVPYDILGQSLETIGDFREDFLQGRYYDRPTLFIAGGKSPYMTPFKEEKDKVDQLFPNSTLDIVDNAGHWGKWFMSFFFFIGPKLTLSPSAC